jgi:hypothetical protein
LPRGLDHSNCQSESGLALYRSGVESGNSSREESLGKLPNQVIVASSPILVSVDLEEYRPLAANVSIPFLRQKRDSGDRWSRYSSGGGAGGRLVPRAIGRGSDFPRPSSLIPGLLDPDYGPPRPDCSDSSDQRSMG